MRLDLLASVLLAELVEGVGGGGSGHITGSWVGCISPVSNRDNLF